MQGRPQWLLAFVANGTSLSPQHLATHHLQHLVGVVLVTLSALLVGVQWRRARSARHRGARARRGLRRRDAAGLAVARAVAELAGAPEARVLLGCSLLCRRPFVAPH